MTLNGYMTMSTAPSRDLRLMTADERREEIRGIREKLNNGSQSEDALTKFRLIILDEGFVHFLYQATLEPENDGRGESKAL